MATPARKDVIAIGGSTGSTPVLTRLIEQLPPDFPASVFISTHIPAQSMGYLAEMLGSGASIPVVQARDGQPIESGQVYVAAPDRHLLLLGNTIRLGPGPRENLVRPAIDPMFRSAALSFGSRVVGVVLTGKLNDGASGLHMIKACGGTAVVQHPIDAEADEMPLAALQAADVDHVVAAAELATLLVRLSGTEAGPALAAPADLQLEVEIALGARLGSALLRQLATPSALSCPDCQGVLSEVHDAQPLRYRCQIGHSYTAEVLSTRTGEFDHAIRVAMRMMEERVTLVERMALDAHETGRSAVAHMYDARAEEYRRYAATLREAAVSALGSRPPQQD